MNREMRSMIQRRDAVVGQLSVQPTFSSHQKMLKNGRKSFVFDIFSQSPWLCVDERESEKRRGYSVGSVLIFSLIPPQPGFCVEGAFSCQ